MKKPSVKPIVSKLNNIIIFFRKPIIKVLISFLIIVFVLIYFVSNYHELAYVVREIKPNYLFVFLALFFSFITVCIGTFTWWFILSWLGYRRNVLAIVKGYALAGLAKYIPGFVWQYAGRSYYLIDHKIPMKTIGLAIVLEFLMVTALGGILSSASYLIVGYKIIESSSMINLLIITLMIALIMFVLFLPKIFISLTNKQTNQKNRLDNQFYWVAVIINFTGWIILSLAYSLIIASLRVENISFPIALFLHSTNFFIGNLFLPIPNGLVVREAIIVFLAKDLANEYSLILSSLLLRMAILFSEILLVVTLHIFSMMFPGNTQSSFE